MDRKARELPVLRHNGQLVFRNREIFRLSSDSRKNGFAALFIAEKQTKLSLYV